MDKLRRWVTKLGIWVSKFGRWVAKLVVRLLVLRQLLLGSNPDMSLEYKMCNISRGVANTL